MADRDIVEFAVSADGTRIGFRRIGAGPALVIVHGGINTGEDWLPTARLLADRFTCFVMDRRGRGASGDGDTYSLAREGEDIAAVLDAAGPEAVLVAHSFGAACALEMAVTRPVHKMIVYEPPLSVRDDADVTAFVDAFRALMEQGRTEDAVAYYLSDWSGMSEENLARYRETPRWRRMLDLAPTIAREALALREDLGEVTRYRAIKAPALALVGALSDARERAVTAALRAAMPQLAVSTLAGEGHTAQRSAPGLLAKHIAAFAAG